MRTVKIKLQFPAEKSKTERRATLMEWAKTILRNQNNEIVEENHFERMSYVVVKKQIEQQVSLSNM